MLQFDFYTHFKNKKRTEKRAVNGFFFVLARTRYVYTGRVCVCDRFISSICVCVLGGEG